MTTSTTPTRTTTPGSRIGIAVFLIITGAIGLLGSFSLVLDEFRKYADPDAKLSCDVSVFVSCSDVMASWQGHLFGFPNPVLGVMGFVAPIAVGVFLLAGGVIRARGFWTVFNAGVFLAWLFVTWLFTQTVFVIGALCPWCMLVWSMTIPMFWVFTAWNLRQGGLPFGERGRRIGAAVFPWAWLIVLVDYLVIIVTILIEFPTLLSSLF